MYSLLSLSCITTKYLSTIKIIQRDIRQTFLRLLGKYHTNQWSKIDVEKSIWNSNKGTLREKNHFEMASLCFIANACALSCLGPTLLFLSKHFFPVYSYNAPTEFSTTRFLLATIWKHIIQDSFRLSIYYSLNDFSNPTDLNHLIFREV